MKTSACNPFLLLGLAALSATLHAAPVTWGSATAIVDASDVSTNGTLMYAYNWANSTRTVNGVTFTGTNSSSTVGTNLTLTQWGNVNNTAFNSGSNPFASLPADYRAMLVGATFNNSASGGTGTNTVTLNNLTPGNQYQIQFWVGDPRAVGSGRSETLSSAGGNSVILAFPANVAGALGQYAVGTFTADAATQDFTVSSVGITGSVPQMNALQLRDLGVPGVTMAPSFSVNSGSYVVDGSTLPVTLTSESGATIYYTMDGNDPTGASPSGASPLIVNIPVPATLSLKAFATVTGKTGSAVVSRDYTTIRGTGTWTNTAGGSWTTDTNWLDGFIPNGTDLTANFGTLNLSADTTVTLDGSWSVKNLVFDDQNTTKHAWTISGDTGSGDLLMLASSGGQPTITTHVNATLDDAGLSTFGGFTKTGAGTLTIAGTNAWYGTTTVTAGMLESAGTNSTGTLAAVGGGTLKIAGGTLASGPFNADSGASILVSDGIWTANCSSNPAIGSQNASAATATFTQTGGTVDLTGTSNVLYTSNWGGQLGNVTLAGGIFNASEIRMGMRGNSTVTLSNSAVANLSTVFAFGHTINIGSPAARILNLGDGNTFSGGTSIHDGGTSGVLATPKVHFLSGAGNATVNFHGGTLRASASATTYMQGLTSANVLEGGGIIDTNGLDITIAQSLLHGGVAPTDGGLVKKGTGTLTLASINTYTGATTVTAGTLAISAAGSVALSDITVPGGGTLRVDTTGKVLKAVTVESGGILSLAAESGATTTVSNALSFTGTPSFTVKPVFATAPTTGTFELLTPGSITGTAGTITTDLGIYGGSRVYVGSTALTAGKLVLTMTVGGTAADLTWNNAAATGKWSANSPTDANFDNAGSNDSFFNQDSVTFNGTAFGPVTLVGLIVPAEVVVDSATGKDYTFDGDGSIAGVGSLTKSGDSTLTIHTANAYSGGTNLDGGTLALGNAGALGTSGAISFGGGTLQYSAGNTTDYSARLGTSGQQFKVDTNGQTVTWAAALAAGSGTLTKQGEGTLRLTAAPNNGGGIVVNGGTLEVNGSIVVYGGGDIQINEGGTFRTTGNRYDFNGVTFTFGPDGGGTLQNSSDDLYGGLVQLNAANTFVTTGGARNLFDRTGASSYNLNNHNAVFNVALGTDEVSDLRVTCPLYNTGGIVKSGAGRLEIAASNTYAGPTTVEEGTLIVSGALGTSTQITVAEGAAFELPYSGTQTFRPAASGTVNSISGAGDARFSGVFTFNLSAAETTPGSSWVVVDAATLNETYTTEFIVTGGFAEEVEGSGVWTYDDGIRPWTFDQATGKLSVGAPQGYNGWIAGYFPGETDPAIIGPEADPDHDGVPNGIEFLTGSVPNDAGSNNAPEIVRNPATGDLVVTFQRVDTAEAYQVTVGHSTTLETGSWTGIVVPNDGIAGPPVTVVDNGSDPDAITVVIPANGAPKKFARVGIAIPTAP